MSTTTEIPEELKEKLKLIERETEFFSQLPQKPNVLLFVMWGVCGISAAIAAVLAFKSGGGFRSRDYFLPLFLLAIAASNAVTYFYERRFFNLYSAACKIINYYKKKENFKT